MGEKKADKFGCLRVGAGGLNIKEAPVTRFIPRHGILPGCNYLSNTVGDFRSLIHKSFALNYKAYSFGTVA